MPPIVNRYPQISILDNLKQYRHAAIALPVIYFAVTITLWGEGRVWWCQAGDMWPWAWNIWSQHNSQHIVDPYAFTHMLHGVLEFWLIGLVFKRMPLAWRLVLAVTIEAIWEIAENSPFVIERYRTVTISLDYFGDSIINSMADITCCLTGFLIAHKLRFLRSVFLFLATEVILIFWIHDSLIINIIMLVRPIEAIKAWQMTGH